MTIKYRKISFFCIWLCTHKLGSGGDDGDGDGSSNNNCSQTVYSNERAVSPSPWMNANKSGKCTIRKSMQIESQSHFIVKQSTDSLGQFSVKKGRRTIFVFLLLLLLPNGICLCVLALVLICPCIKWQVAYSHCERESAVFGRCARRLRIKPMYDAKVESRIPSAPRNVNLPSFSSVFRCCCCFPLIAQHNWMRLSPFDRKRLLLDFARFSFISVLAAWQFCRHRFHCSPLRFFGIESTRIGIVSMCAYRISTLFRWFCTRYFASLCSSISTEAFEHICIIETTFHVKSKTRHQFISCAPMQPYTINQCTTTTIFQPISNYSLCSIGMILQVLSIHNQNCSPFFSDVKFHCGNDDSLIIWTSRTDQISIDLNYSIWSITFFLKKKCFHSPWKKCHSKSKRSYCCY